MFTVASIASLIVFASVMADYARSGYFTVFHPFTLYALFHGVVFVLRPILSLFLDYSFVYKLYQFSPTDLDRVVALLAANLGFLSFAFFSLRPSSGAVGMKFATDPQLEAEKSRLAGYFIWAMVLCAPIAIWSLAGQFGAAFNNVVYADMIFDRSTGVAYNTSGNGYFYEAQLMLAPAWDHGTLDLDRDVSRAGAESDRKRRNRAEQDRLHRSPKLKKSMIPENAMTAAA